MGGKRFMQLELKHYAAYLSYNVECKRSNSEGNIFLLNTETINFAVKNKDLLILRPLSDLNKEIEANGEKLVPIVELLKKATESDEFKVISIEIKETFCKITFDTCGFDDDYKDFFIVFNNCDFNCDINIFNLYELYQLLLSWHFDIFDLINNGLAVDFNELKKINYELQNTK